MALNPFEKTSGSEHLGVQVEHLHEGDGEDCIGKPCSWVSILPRPNNLVRFFWKDHVAF